MNILATEGTEFTEIDYSALFVIYSVNDGYLFFCKLRWGIIYKPRDKIDFPLGQALTECVDVFN